MGHVLSRGGAYLQHTQLTTWCTSLKDVHRLYDSCLENFKTLRYGIWVNGFYVDDKCALLGCYAVSSCNFLPVLQSYLLGKIIQNKACCCSRELCREECGH
jgi:hypothetical protein